MKFFFYFSIGILGQVWYLIVSIPDLCTLSYFNNRVLFLEGVECFSWKVLENCCMSCLRQLRSALYQSHVFRFTGCWYLALTSGSIGTISWFKFGDV